MITPPDVKSKVKFVFIFTVNLNFCFVSVMYLFLGHCCIACAKTLNVLSIDHIRIKMNIA